jgi:hypothetical protein
MAIRASVLDNHTVCCSQLLVGHNVGDHGPEGAGEEAVSDAGDDDCHIGSDEGHGKHHVTSKSCDDGGKDAQDVPADQVDAEAKRGRGEGRDEVDEAVDEVGLSRIHGKLSLEEGLAERDEGEDGNVV